MDLYLYKIGTTTPVLTIKNVTSYTDNSVEGEGSPDLDGEPSDRIARVFELFSLDTPGFSGFLPLSYPVCGP